jgi:hypothetical protein
MPPLDPTPLGDEMVHRLPERKFPQPKPGAASDEPARDRPAAGEAGAAPDMRDRPALPEHPQPMAADVEDEEADPVVDAGPDIDDGVKGLRKQRG